MPRLALERVAVRTRSSDQHRGYDRHRNIDHIKSDLGEERLHTAAARARIEEGLEVRTTSARAGAPWRSGVKAAHARRACARLGGREQPEVACPRRICQT